MKTALVTGYSGQDGTFLTRLLLEKGYQVVAIGRRISTEPPMRVRGRFNFVKEIDSGQLKLVEGDLLSSASLINIIREHQPHEIYNLASQSHVGRSFYEPESTIESNLIGVINLVTALEAVGGDDWRMYQASTSEMFGDTDPGEGFDENSEFDPKSPYAIAKAAAHQYCKMKREQGRFIACGILFNHESEIRGGDFVTQKIVRGVNNIMQAYQEATEPLPVLELGNLDSARDWGYAGDYVEAMHLMLQQTKPDDFVVGTGTSHTVREFVEMTFDCHNRNITWKGEGTEERGYIGGEVVVRVSDKYYRPNDVTQLKANPKRAHEVLGWYAKHTLNEIIDKMVMEAPH